jgi:hypothetical protein
MKRALCVGINKYLQPGNDLRGCRNDAFDMAAFFEIELGIPRENIVILLDRAATKANITAEYERLKYGAEEGDYLAYAHSSHGTQQFDLDGDEPDLYDEALCCYDTMTLGQDWHPDTVILDDERHKFHASLPEGVLFEAWIDTCHSGDGLRNMGLSYDRARLMLPRHDLLPAQRRRIYGNRDNLNVVLWAACAADQLSADAFIDGKWCGAFTNAFLSIYKEVGRSLLLARVRTRLRNAGYNQVPQLETVDPRFINSMVGA